MDEKQHPVEVVVGYALAFAGLAFVLFLLYVLVAVMSVS
jgi:Na+-transporting methylmalonyl-CoA/oxaloacetate decarboxylase gamma subunit